MIKFDDFDKKYRLIEQVDKEIKKIKFANLLSLLNQFVINADEGLGEKSACSILSRLGFYVPKSIILNADKIYGDEVLDARSGLILARQLKGKTLFEFVESLRGWYK